MPTPPRPLSRRGRGVVGVVCVDAHAAPGFVHTRDGAAFEWTWQQDHGTTAVVSDDGLQLDPHRNNYFPVLGTEVVERRTRGGCGCRTRRTSPSASRARSRRRSRPEWIGASTPERSQRSHEYCRAFADTGLARQSRRALTTFPPAVHPDCTILLVLDCDARALTLAEVDGVAVVPAVRIDELPGDRWWPVAGCNSDDRSAIEIVETATLPAGAMAAAAAGGAVVEVVEVAFDDTDGDAIVFRRKANGKLDYYVNEVLKVADLTSLTVDEDGRIHLDGRSVGGWGSRRMTQPDEPEDAQRVRALQPRRRAAAAAAAAARRRRRRARPPSRRGGCARR